MAKLAGAQEAPLHRDCTAPVYRLMRGVAAIGPARLRQFSNDNDLSVDYAEGYGLLGGFKPPEVLSTYISVRCRKCDKCLDAKRRQWTAKAIVEHMRSTRTWFGTLTVGPDRRLWAKAVAMRETRARRCEALADLKPSDQTKAIARVLLPEITRWLKRVRKNAGAPFRYLLVVEAHQDHFPHFHLLLHETGQPVGKRVLEGAWRYGFSQFRLLPQHEMRAVGYVCKYISKSPQTRIRASRRYGQSEASSYGGD